MIKEILNQFPLTRTCFSKYLDWLEHQDSNIEDNDLIIALKNNKIKRLKLLEERLVQAKSILNLKDNEFCSKFGFNKDLLTSDVEKIHDVLAEPMIVVDLDKYGFSKIEKLPAFIKQDGKKYKSADLIAVLSGCKYAIELKTIRLENNPKPTPGVPTGNSFKPSWWRTMFRNNVITKIEDKKRRVIKQLTTTKNLMQCDAIMLILYTRRLGPSTLMENDDYVDEISSIYDEYPGINLFMIKDYFGSVNFYPDLRGLT